MAKAKTFILPLIFLVSFSAISMALTACVLDEQGTLPPPRDWLVSYGGTGQWQKINSSSIPPLYLAIGDCCTLFRPEICLPYLFGTYKLFEHFGDFNADGNTDVFASRDGKWLVSNSGANPLQIINSSNVAASSLRLGDFNGDCKTDVFASWGGKWRVSYGGTGPWQIINSSNIGVSDLRLGDFNGDGKTDVFASWAGKWRVSYGGTGPWQIINSSNFGVLQLRFGDFNGDGKTDVFRVTGSYPI